MSEPRPGIDFRIAPEQLPFAYPPYDYEFIATRLKCRWRIRDSKDNAVGWAENEEAAIFICEHLNAIHKPYT